MMSEPVHWKGIHSLSSQLFELVEGRKEGRMDDMEGGAKGSFGAERALGHCSLG